MPSFNGILSVLDAITPELWTINNDFVFYSSEPWSGCQHDFS